jgi:hypothetical protein
MERQDYHFHNPHSLDADMCGVCHEVCTYAEDDMGRMMPFCEYCSGDKIRDFDREFQVHWYGQDEHGGFHGWPQGLIAENREEMQFVVEYMRNNDALSTMQHQHNGKESDIGAALERADVINSNPARQYFFYHNGRQVGCLTEIL